MRRVVFLLLVVGGAVLTGSALLLMNPDHEKTSFLKGMGVGMLVVGFLLWAKNERMLKNKQQMEKNKREEYDERNIEISQRAFVAAARILIFSLVLVTIGIAFFEPMYSLVISCVICFFLVLYAGCYYYYQKKM